MVAMSKKPHSVQKHTFSVCLILIGERLPGSSRLPCIQSILYIAHESQGAGLLFGLAIIGMPRPHPKPTGSKSPALELGMFAADKAC